MKKTVCDKCGLEIEHQCVLNENRDYEVFSAHIKYKYGCIDDKGYRSGILQEEVDLCSKCFAEIEENYLKWLRPVYAV